VRGVADPNHPSTIELASAVAKSSSSASVYVVPSVLVLALVIIAIVILRRRRTSRVRKVMTQSASKPLAAPELIAVLTLLHLPTRVEPLV